MCPISPTNRNLRSYQSTDKLNIFFRIREDGQVYTSIRLTVVAACRMYLNHFPMDVQVCNLKAESFGYDTNDVIFEWLPKKPLDLASDLQDRLECFFINIFLMNRKIHIADIFFAIVFWFKILNKELKV